MINLCSLVRLVVVVVAVVSLLFRKAKADDEGE